MLLKQLYFSQLLLFEMNSKSDKVVCSISFRGPVISVVSGCIAQPITR